MSEAMTINDIINQLGSLRASSAEFAKSDPESEIWKADVTACETAIRILAALSGEGCTISTHAPAWGATAIFHKGQTGM